MKSSKPTHVKIEQVEALVEQFLNVIEATLNTVDQIADVNTQTHDGKKYISASQFRMNLRKLKMQLIADLKKDMNPEKDTNDAS